MTGPVIDGNPWLRRYHPTRDRDLTLLCFPHAGGAASYFRPLSAALAPSTDTLCLQYPGRQDRRMEAPLDDLDTLTEQIYEALPEDTGQPWALFGHSMGALLAFEIARRLEQEPRRAPLGLIVSGRRAPPTHRVESMRFLDDHGLMAEVARHDATAADLLADEEIRRMILPAIRADYTAVETYQFRPGPALRCPLSVLTGDRDTECSVEEANRWQECTHTDFRMRVFPGGHFFLNSLFPHVIAALQDDLAAFRVGAHRTDTRSAVLTRRDAAVWRRLGCDHWQTLTAALDNPDGEQLHDKELAQARAETAAHAAAEREKRRPVCAECGTKFTDERWEQTERRRTWSDDGTLCAACQEQKAATETAAKSARTAPPEPATPQEASPEPPKGLGRRR